MSAVASKETVESSGHITIKDEPRETRTQILERAYKHPNAVLVVEGVKPRETVKKIQNAGGLLRTVDRLPGVVGAAPMVNGNAIATYGAVSFQGDGNVWHDNDQPVDVRRN